MQRTDGYSNTQSSLTLYSSELNTYAFYRSFENRNCAFSFHREQLFRHQIPVLIFLRNAHDGPLHFSRVGFVSSGDSNFIFFSFQCVGKKKTD